jgi:Tol biopolymer transport system component
VVTLATGKRKTIIQGGMDAQYLSTGHLLYARMWVDRQGRSQPVTEVRRAFDFVSLSTDGQRIALQIDQATVEVWVYDLARTTFTRLVHGWDNGSAVWSPDGTRVTFESARSTSHGLFWQLADGSGPAERLTADVPDFLDVESWSPDGRVGSTAGIPLDAGGSSTGILNSRCMRQT